MRYSPTEPPETQMLQIISFEFNRNTAQMSCVRSFFLQQISLWIFVCSLLFIIFLSILTDKIFKKREKNCFRRTELKRKMPCLPDTINENNKTIDVTIK